MTTIMTEKEIQIPEVALILLVGTSGAGKSTFARKHFLSTEILSSDVCRGLVSDDENAQDASADAFDVLHLIAEHRLRRGLLTVVDATNVQESARRSLLRVARKQHCLAQAIVLDIAESTCLERNKTRPDRDFGPHVIRNQARQLKRSMRQLKREGFSQVHILKSEEEINQVSFKRIPLWTNKRNETGPFDIIGDIHGCFDELVTLLTKLGYHVDQNTADSAYPYSITPPAQRKAIFVGDLVDRGPKNPEVLRLVMSMIHQGHALCVSGNHDDKLKRKLEGRQVKVNHGLEQTLAQLESEPEAFIQQVSSFLDGLISHYVLDNGRLVTAHAGMKEHYQGRASGTVRAFALYGETTGETDEYGLPVRYEWANDYRGKALVVYGHTPTIEPEFFNNTICIDTGCVFGGKLTALRYPERELVSVPASQVYYEPSRPLFEEQDTRSLQHRHDDVLNISDVQGKRFITTPLRNKICIEEQYAAAALETLSRFTVNPKWINYLPPTMSPAHASEEADLLEDPQQALDYFQQMEVETVICQEKHMGSRAIVQICKTPDVSRRVFGIQSEAIGCCYTRTGRRFFNDDTLEQAFLLEVQQAVTKAGLWDTLKTDWLTLDCELMPWSFKASELIRQQYAAVGCAGNNVLPVAYQLLEQAALRGVDLNGLNQRIATHHQHISGFRQAYQQYCWSVTEVNQLKLAPFHIMASEGAMHTDKNHQWHMAHISDLAKASKGLIQATDYRIIHPVEEHECQEVTQWWQSLLEKGSEGIVIKPMDFVCHTNVGLAQPALKVRGKEYLRLIYGPNYDAPENLVRLKKRGLGKKRRLAIKEFSLGLAALQRFVGQEPLRRVHECILGVIALSAEPVDPRL
ncbi:polynucleotide kinase-phosphatase [Zooshikella ganghwensis]|uniref:polynucleotide kinase-phosphatase n=1 Tax=Zooshikella ganghwensis TaxID=202772 RepID=UPI00042912E9|nr:polynucleotide kinase-phosphatase [Zooshikella ganghwensis]